MRGDRGGGREAPGTVPGALFGGHLRSGPMTTETFDAVRTRAALVGQLDRGIWEIDWDRYAEVVTRISRIDTPADLAAWREWMYAEWPANRPEPA